MDQLLLFPIPLEQECLRQVHFTFPRNSLKHQALLFIQLSQGNAPAVQKMSRRSKERAGTGGIPTGVRKYDQKPSGRPDSGAAGIPQCILWTNPRTPRCGSCGGVRYATARNYRISDPAFLCNSKSSLYIPAQPTSLSIR
ncbi:hypothetical protein TNCV_1677331 [Trichonephila clavipes]|nr:hypothetical protein TNCV_1677331 [Trichonephila clavipes]